MNQSTFNNYIKAGELAKLIKRDIKMYLDTIRPISVDKLYDKICEIINYYNCDIIFPPNINGPGIVAHDTAEYKDPKIIYIVPLGLLRTLACFCVNYVR